MIQIDSIAVRRGPRPLRCLRAAALFVSAAALLLGSPLSASDWPQWRGVTQLGVSAETGLPITLHPAHWPTNPIPASTASISAQTAGGGELTQPTLYLHGRDDGCIGVEVAESAREMSPWATVEIVDGAGHYLQLEQPDVVNARIVEFLTAG